MKSKFLAFITFFAVTSTLIAENPNLKYFPKEDMLTTGVYYYPEHWEQSQWERDFKNMANMGFEFVHMAEFAWQQLEPEEGKYNFEWLDKAIELAKKNNLKIVLCTSTPTPPVWLTRKHPEILRQSFDKKYDHGARQHNTHGGKFYKEYCQKIIELLAKRYGNDSAIIGWQIDNEPQSRNNDTHPDSLEGFQKFLKEKYSNNINKLNKAWGANFWSQNFNSFEQINFNSENPHHYIDMLRYHTKESADFLDSQAKTLKKYIKNQWVTTNFIPAYTQGLITACKELDFASYTRYMIPGYQGIGKRGFRIGGAYSIFMANDWFRTISDGLYGVMELQPGQVNWGAINPQPLPNAVRLWLWSVWAGDAKFICTYRYRHPIYGFELYHYGIVGPDGVTPSMGGEEFITFMKEMKVLREHRDAKKASKPEHYLKRKTAVLYSQENTWELNKRKQSNQWNTERHVRSYYSILKRFGCPVDIIDENKDFSKYPFLVVPAYIMMDTPLVEKLTKYAENGGNLIISIRSGYMNKNAQLYEKKFGGLLYDLVGAKQMKFFDMLPSGHFNKIEMDNKSYDWSVWAEIFEPKNDTQVWAKHSGDFYPNEAVVLHRKLGKGTVTYIGAETKNYALEKSVMQKVFKLANTDILDLPEGVTMEYRDGFGIILNYSDKPFKANFLKDKKFIIGSEKIPTAQVSIFEE